MALRERQIEPPGLHPALRMSMPSIRRLALTALLSLGIATPGAAQALFSIPVIPVSVVRAPRETARFGDTTWDVVFIVRGPSTPERPLEERPLEEAWVAVGAPGTDVRSHPALTAGTRADGTARFVRLNRDSLDVVVLRIGYGAVRFSVGLAKQCHQTIEVYVVQQAIIDGEVGGPPRPRPRVVLTTCAPPALTSAGAVTVRLPRACGVRRSHGDLQIWGEQLETQI
jgi:hypothetical protein